MAETAVGLVIDKLIPLLTEEASLLKGIHKEVNGIKRELQSILCFLKDADKRAEAAEGDNNMDDGVKLWVEELREAALRIENVIDEYMYNIAFRHDFHQEEELPSRTTRFVGFLRNILCLICELKPRHDIASKIQELKLEVRDINQRGTAYRFEQGSSSGHSNTKRSWSDPRDDSRFLGETEVVGIQGDRKELVVRLESEDPHHEVISIVGMAGIGKTTFANKVFDEVKEKFDCFAWIDVSQTYNNADLLKSLILKFHQSRNESISQGADQEMDVYTLTKSLRDYLHGKSYFVTFDDVWDINFWAGMKNALPNESGNRGKVVITTRNVEVANYCKTSSSVHIHHMQLLSFEDSWELFCKKVFHSEKDCWSPELEGLARQVVQKCGGLPLAIVVVGGLLATKNKSVLELRKLLACLSSELESNQHLASITRILSFSYNDLPYYLKPCFLYFGIFPEDSIIRNHRLFREWIAEGFVKEQKGKVAEVVAEEYLTELLNRSMVQAALLDIERKCTSCRVHDLLRDFALTKMNDLRFCRVFSKDDNLNLGTTSRRISVSQGCADSVVRKSSTNTLDVSNVRSVFVFDKEEIIDALVTKIVESFKLLKVLDFEDASISHLPNDIGSMFHLRYISLRGSNVKYLPKSIGKLENLETLDLKMTLVDEVPVELNRLRKLRYLLVYHMKALDSNFSVKTGVKVKKGFGCLKALQRLHQVDLDVDGVDVLEEIGKLKELRKLGINNLRSKNGSDLCSCIQELKHLESIRVISAIEEDEPIDLESMKFPPKFLRHLYFSGRLKNFPSWITKLESLVRVQISFSKFEEDPLEVLQNLPNLLELQLFKDAYYGKNLQFKAEMFPKLKALYLCGLSRLNTLVIQQNALPNLECFFIGPFPQLEEMACGFHNLKNLNYLGFLEMSVPFLLFHDFQSIQNVPNVTFNYNLRGRLRHFDLNWVMTAQGCVPDDEKEEWASLTFEQLYGKVTQQEVQNYILWSMQNM